MSRVILKSLFLILISFAFYGCPEKGIQYKFDVLIYNATTDTLTFRCSTNNLAIRSAYYDNFVLHPYDTVYGEKSAFGPVAFINEPPNMVQSFFQQWPAPLDTVIILRHDTLVALWKYPNFSGPCTEHSFFNYNSWKSWKVNSEEGRIMFTIYREDLILKQKW